MAGKQRGDFLGIFGILSAQGIGENRRVGLGEGLAGQHFGEALARRLHQRRVESAGHRDEPRGKPGRLQLFESCLDCGICAGNHRLARAVVIGQRDAFHAVQRFGDGVGVGRYSGHGAGFVVSCILDGAATGLGKLEQGRIGNHAGGGQRDVLAVAVARGHVRTHAQPLERVAQTDFYNAQRGLGDHCVGDFQALLLFLLRAERRRRIDVSAELFGEAPSERLLGLFQAGAEFGEVERQVTQHVRFLGTLAGEQEGDFAAWGTEGQVDALRVVERLFGFERGFGFGEFRVEVFGRGGHDGQAGLRRWGSHTTG